MTEIPSTTKLYFGPWYRRSPYFESTLRAGCTAYDIYNKMYLPAEYDDPNVEYQALQDGVTLWDVGVERTVQVSGPDADRLIDMVTCRDLTKCAVGQGKYMLVTAPDGGIVNDPVLLHVEPRTPGGCSWPTPTPACTRWACWPTATWMPRSATPTCTRCRCRARSRRSRSRRSPARASTTCKYYWCGHFEIGDIPVVISRTGWSAVPGFEVNLLDGSRGAELWDAIMAAGEEFDIRPISPNEARRVEAGIFNWGSDITLKDTPFHVTGLERLVEEQPQDYIGKAALERDPARAASTASWSASSSTRPSR